MAKSSGPIRRANAIGRATSSAVAGLPNSNTATSTQLRRGTREARQRLAGITGNGAAAVAARSQLLGFISGTNIALAARRRASPDPRFRF